MATALLGDRWMHYNGYVYKNFPFQLRFSIFFFVKNVKKIIIPRKKWKLFDWDDIAMWCCTYCTECTHACVRCNDFHVHVFHLCRWPFARRASEHVCVREREREWTNRREMLPEFPKKKIDIAHTSIAYCIRHSNKSTINRSRMRKKTAVRLKMNQKSGCCHSFNSGTCTIELKYL